MDPVSVLGITSTTLSVIARLTPTLLRLKDQWQDIRQVGESNAAFAADLDAFQFSLSVLETELSKGSLIAQIQTWWDPERLTALLINATKTISRLETIFDDIVRQRGVLKSVRQYYRASRYDHEITHLSIRLKTYTSCLSIAVLLLAANNSQASLPQTSNSLQLSLLEERISRLNASVLDISENLKIHDEPQASQDVLQEPDLSEDSEELIDIVTGLISSASSVVSPSQTQAGQSSSGPNDPTVTLADSLSLTGLSLGSGKRRSIGDWADRIESEPPSTPFGVGPSLNPSAGTLFISDTSQSSVSLGDVDLEGLSMETQLSMKRYKLALNHLVKQRFGEALPFLEKTLETFDKEPETFNFIGAPQHTDVHLLYAKALMETNPWSKGTDLSLKELISERDITDITRLEAQHTLAELQALIYPNDLSRAKATCLDTVKERLKASKTDPKTLMSIDLLVAICQMMGDSDEAMWRDMLPKDFKTQWNIDTFRRDNEHPSIWDAGPRRGLRRLQDCPNTCWVRMTLSPGGTLIGASRTEESAHYEPKDMFEFAVWDASSGRLMHLIGTGSTPRGRICPGRVAFSPNDRLIASGSLGNTVNVRDARTGKLLRVLELPASEYSNSSTYPPTVAFSPDGILLAVGINTHVQVWNTLQWRRAFVLIAEQPDFDSDFTHSSESANATWDMLEFSPDGKRLVGSQPDNLIVVWTVATRMRLTTIHSTPNRDVHRALCFTPDNLHVAIYAWSSSRLSPAHLLYLWEPNSGNKTVKLKPSGPIRRVCFNPRSTLVAATWNNGKKYTLCCWDVKRKKQLYKHEFETRVVQFLRFSPDGETLAVGCRSSKVVFYDAVKGDELEGA